MGAEDLKIDEVPDRFVFDTLDFTGNSNIIVTETQLTTMSAAEKRGWLITRVDYGFSESVPPQIGSVDLSIAVQLQLGSGVVFVDTKSSLNVCTFGLGHGKGGPMVWPISWPGPVLIASRQLTALVKATDDHPALQNHKFAMTVWFHNVELTKTAWLEIAGSAGVL